MHVFGNFDRAALDREYNARESVSDFDFEMARYKSESERVRREFSHRPDIVYDARSGETLDLFPAAAAGPLFVWIHGGYWRALSKDDNSFAAAGLARHGFTTAVINYTLAPAVTLDEIVRQVRSAIAFLHRNRADLRVSDEPFAVGGSSAGGHLAAMLLADAWRHECGVPEDIIGACLALSGLHDLEPIRHSYVNDVIRLDEAAARRNSPMHCIPVKSSARLLASVGGLETTEFKRQTTEYVDKWSAAGHRADIIDMPGYQHFDIALSMRDPESPLVRAVKDAMR